MDEYLTGLNSTTQDSKQDSTNMLSCPSLERFGRIRSTISREVSPTEPSEQSNFARLYQEWLSTKHSKTRKGGERERELSLLLNMYLHLVCQYGTFCRRSRKMGCFYSEPRAQFKTHFQPDCCTSDDLSLAEERRLYN